MAREHMTVRVSPTAKQLLGERAQALGVTRSELLRLLVGEALVDEPLLRRVARRADAGREK